MGKLVFIDSSGLIAHFIESDPYHRRATGEIRRILKEGRSFLTTNYVFDEVISRVRRKTNPEETKKVGQAIFKSKVIKRIYITEEMEENTWKLFVKYLDHELSFTDVTCLAVMRAHSIEEILTFDMEFEKVGVIRLPRMG